MKIREKRYKVREKLLADHEAKCHPGSKNATFIDQNMKMLILCDLAKTRKREHFRKILRCSWQPQVSPGECQSYKLPAKAAARMQILYTDKK